MNRTRFASALAMSALAAILLPSSLRAQITFVRTYGGSGNDEGWSVQQTTDGGYVIAGQTGPEWPADVYLVKTDSEGDTVWTKTFGGSDDDYGCWIRQTTDGGYIVAGFTYSYGTGMDDLYLIRTDADGNALWTRTYGGSESDAGFSVQQTADGGFIASGMTMSFSRDWEAAWLVKTDAVGDTEWTRTFEGQYFQGVWVQQTDDSGFIVTGSSGGTKLIKLDSSGSLIWIKAYPGEGYSVQQTADGGYIVAGKEGSNEERDVYIIKTDGDGDTLWTRTFGGTRADEGLSVQQTTDGGYVVVGYSVAYGTDGKDAYVLRLNDEGDTLWTRTFGGPDHDCGTSVQQTADGGFVITGWTGSLGAGGTDAWLVKTDSLGNLRNPEANPPGEPGLSLSCKPNPCRNWAVLHLATGRHDHSASTLRVFDAQGRVIRSLSSLLSSSPSLTWDGTDDLGRTSPSGTYFARVDVGGKHATTRVILQH
jgi:hypothetical protein